MKIGFIGCGNMGGALAKAVKKIGADIFLSDRDFNRASTLAEEIGATPCTNIEAAFGCDMIFLAVKPNVIKSVLSELSSVLGAKVPLLVTMAAGVKIAALEEIVSSEYPIIRIMPNTPCSVGRGMITWCHNAAVSEDHKSAFIGAMSAAGRLDLIPEGMIDAASAIAGCGPAFVYMFADALADGGVACGLPRDKALTYAIETIIGAGEMMKASNKHPEQLKDEVCSPGGSTIEGVLALEDGAFRATASSAVVSAFEKTKKLG